MTRLLDVPDILTKPLPLPELAGMRPAVHVFDRPSVLAIDAAIACGRPLLVRGEPGAGKSQLARAAAKALGRVFVSRFVDARTEVHDLMWHHDAVTRLAEAQIQRSADPEAVARELERIRYVAPGPLWWALDWDGALEQATEKALKIKPAIPRIAEGCSSKGGVVLLIDEIDKADTSVPNGLLEVLGQRTFAVPGRDAPVHATGATPLVLFTTNEDRVLPDAFVRRCVVLHLQLPREHGELLAWLRTRGEAHFPELAATEVLERAAVQIANDRESGREANAYQPGLAEYIDLITAAIEPGVVGALERMAELGEFFRKRGPSRT
ncbi:AAA family ATPase [Nannocystaceae bacterium ST9]